MNEESTRNNQGPAADVTEAAEEDGGPRVVDRRRYLGLLKEEIGEGVSTDDTPRYPSYVDELLSKVKASEARVLDYAERYRQSREQMEKEVEAIRARLARTVQDRLDESRARFIRNLLDVLDNLRRAVRAAENDPAPSPIVDGLRATLSLFERNLEAEGVTAVDPLGEQFDPRFHEAIDTVAVERERDGQVIEVIEAGYRLGDLVLIRPARVRVGKSKDETEN